MIEHRYVLYADEQHCGEYKTIGAAKGNKTRNCKHYAWMYKSVKWTIVKETLTILSQEEVWSD
tara:strand:+ start:1222 stop:1410 length:189 start_codon:yes stop_codon:yes gene_type:complete